MFLMHDSPLDSVRGYKSRQVSPQVKLPDSLYQVFPAVRQPHSPFYGVSRSPWGFPNFGDLVFPPMPKKSFDEFIRAFSREATISKELGFRASVGMLTCQQIVARLLQRNQGPFTLRQIHRIFTIVGACSLPTKQEAFDSVEVLLGVDA